MTLHLSAAEAPRETLRRALRQRLRLLLLGSGLAMTLLITAGGTALLLQERRRDLAVQLQQVEVLTTSLLESDLSTAQRQALLAQLIRGMQVEAGGALHSVAVINPRGQLVLGSTAGLAQAGKPCNHLPLLPWGQLHPVQRSITYLNREGLQQRRYTLLAVVDPLAMQAGLGRQGLLTLAGSTVLAAAVMGSLARLLHWRLLPSLQALAETDALTGLPNRGAFMAQAIQQLALAEEQGEPRVVAILDLDHFKRLNDSHGHQAGDHVLREAAALLRANLRSGDLLARLGGEEFALLLAADQPTASALLERLRAQMDLNRSRFEGRLLGTTVSIGAAGSTRFGHHLDHLIAKADAALYRAKQAGRNGLCWAEGSQGNLEGWQPGEQWRRSFHPAAAAVATAN
jgi:diguanylate cyclase (GGDEF)-like protein